MSKRTDLHYGRRGGRFVPDGYTPTDFRGSPRCEVCDRPILTEPIRRRHRVCSPELACCPGIHVDQVGDLAAHDAAHLEVAMRHRP